MMMMIVLDVSFIIWKEKKSRVYYSCNDEAVNEPFINIKKWS